MSEVSQDEFQWYDQIGDQLQVVFDVGCKKDNPFHKYGCEVHQFDPIDFKRSKGIYNQVALSDYIGTSDFYIEYGSVHKRTKWKKPEKWTHLKHTKITVPVTTLDQYCEENNITEIDLLKIDTEGNDYRVLLGSQKMLPHIKMIQFEDWVDDSTEKIKRLLTDYTVTELGGKPLNYKAIRK